MDYEKKIASVLRQSSRPVEDLNKLINSEIRSEITEFADWLRYDDDVFGDFGMNKISVENLYNRYKDELKK